MTAEEFLADIKSQRAVVMCIIIIGEAASKIAERYPNFVDAHSELPWRQMRGMRNRIAHGYFEIDFRIVWDTVQTALPELLQALRQALDAGGKTGA